MTTDPARVDRVRPRLRVIPPPRLRIADVAVFYGARSGGIRTFLDAKSAWSAQADPYEHHLIVPGRRDKTTGTHHQLRAFTAARSNGYRIPLGHGPLQRLLEEIEPDLILVHDPYWALVGAVRARERTGAKIVAVHHGSSALDAAGLPGPSALYEPILRRWFTRAFSQADAVLAAFDPFPRGFGPPILPLRFGLAPEFVPQVCDRGDHVLYVGRLGREKGIFQLLEAAALSPEPWPLRLVGAGPARGRIEHRVRELGLTARVEFRDFIADRAELALAYAQASCVVMPGRYETFGLVALEAAASGAAAVACATAPSAAVLGELCETFEPGNPADLLRAIVHARGRAPQAAASRRLCERFTWPAAFEAETRALRGVLAGQRRMA